MSIRTLHKKLQDKGTRFQDVYNSTRETLITSLPKKSVYLVKLIGKMVLRKVWPIKLRKLSLMVMVIVQKKW
jgi:hypothetical protein